MRAWHNPSHVRGYGRSPSVLVPQDRQQAIFGTLRKDMGQSLRELCKPMGIAVVEGHTRPDHGHWCLSIPPKSRVAQAVGRVKGKAASRLQRAYLGRIRHFPGLPCWAKGYGVRPVGVEEASIRQYSRKQEEQETRAEHLA
jgi:putative transposase